MRANFKKVTSFTSQKSAIAIQIMAINQFFAICLTFNNAFLLLLPGETLLILKKSHLHFPMMLSKSTTHNLRFSVSIL